MEWNIQVRAARALKASMLVVVGGRGVVGPSFTAAFLLGVVHGEKFGVVTLFRRRGLFCFVFF